MWRNSEISKSSSTEWKFASAYRETLNKNILLCVLYVSIGIRAQFALPPNHLVKISSGHLVKFSSGRKRYDRNAKEFLLFYLFGRGQSSCRNAIVPYSDKRVDILSVWRGRIRYSATSALPSDIRAVEPRVGALIYFD